MAFSKASRFDRLSFEQSVWSKALSHPARITILKELLYHGTTPFYTFAKMIPLARTTISQHLRYLRRFGLIEVEEKYPHTFYTLRAAVCKSLAGRLKYLNDSF